MVHVVCCMILIISRIRVMDAVQPIQQSSIAVMNAEDLLVRLTENSTPAATLIQSAIPTSNSQITRSETPIDSLMGEINNLTAPTDINAEDSTPIPD
jgi:hypothetical protein